MSQLKYKRVLLKLSGEALAGEKGHGLDPDTVSRICRELADVASLGLELALVIGGGNIFRGLSSSARGMDRSTADYMGMLATILNAMAVQDALEKSGCPTRVLSAINTTELCEPYIRRRALRHLEKGRIVICAAGTGNPYFTTDTAAALRAMELKCEAIIKGTKVDGIYDKDPVKYPDAVRFSRISYDETLQRRLQVMDALPEKTICRSSSATCSAAISAASCAARMRAPSLRKRIKPPRRNAGAKALFAITRKDDNQDIKETHHG